MALRRALGWSLLLASLALAGCMESEVAWEPVPAQEAAPYPLAPRSILAASRVDPGTSAAVVFFFAVLPLGLVAAWSALWWRHHRRRAAAERALDARAPLKDGHAIVLGQVELEPGATGPAIELAIRQQGSDVRGKNGWFHRWTEYSRTVRVRPFWIRTPNGQRVRVEPDENVALHDDLSRTRRVAHFERVRSAELTVGETVHVRGTLFNASRAGLDAAYRANAAEPVLRPSRFAPMVVSTEAPGATAGLRARFYGRWLVALAALAVALPAAIFPTAALLALTGRTVLARPVATRHWQQYVKPKNRPGYYVDHYGLRSVYRGDGRDHVLADECGVEAWTCAARNACAAVPYTVSALSDEVVQVGDGAQLSDARVFLVVVSGLALLVGFGVSAFRTRPWYLKRRIVDGGSGQIPVFIAGSPENDA